MPGPSWLGACRCWWRLMRRVRGRAGGVPADVAACCWAALDQHWAVLDQHSACASPSTATNHPQVGSQHRSKAEPAGAVVNGKWVASKPKPDEITLTGGWG